MRIHTIHIVSTVFLHGPNRWCYMPVLEAVVDIGELEKYPSHKIDGLYERLTTALPGIAEHRCGLGIPGGFLQRLQEGTWAAHILEHIILEFQTMIGSQCGFGRARETETRGVYYLCFSSPHEKLARELLHLGRDFLLALIDNLDFNLQHIILRLNKFMSKYLDPASQAIAHKARTRRLPTIQLSHQNLMQIGYGKQRQRYWASKTDTTSVIGETISCDKQLTKSLLESCGIPTPEGQLITQQEDTWVIAQEIGLPVVIKPVDSNHRLGVSINLMDELAINNAVEIAKPFSDDLMVERYIEGNYYRLLVIGNKMIAALGEQSTSINEDNATNGRLAQRCDNLYDCTDKVHPETAAQAILAAKLLRLDIAGIDIIAKDISQPLEEQDGAIIEVNAAPDLLQHIKPAHGNAQPVEEAILDLLFPEGSEARIPLIGITSSHHQGLLAECIGQLLKHTGFYTGVACSKGTQINGEWVSKTPSFNHSTGQAILTNPFVEAAVIESSYNTLLREGLAYDRCNIGIVMGIEPEKHLGTHSILTTKQMTNVFRTQVDVVLPDGVAILNADNPLVVDLAQYASTVIFFSYNAKLPLIETHCENGGQAVYLRDNQLILREGNKEQLLLHCEEIMLPKEVLMALCATARALNLPFSYIKNVTNSVIKEVTHELLL